jgi:hypothetical protein
MSESLHFCVREAEWLLSLCFTPLKQKRFYFFLFIQLSSSFKDELGSYFLHEAFQLIKVAMTCS